MSRLTEKHLSTTGAATRRSRRLSPALARDFRPFEVWAIATAGSVPCEAAQPWIRMRHASVLDVAVTATGAAVCVAVIATHRRARTRGQVSETRPHAAQAQ